MDTVQAGGNDLTEREQSDGSIGSSRDSIQAQSRVQIVRQVCGEEAGARSSQEVNLQVRVRIRSSNHNLDQTQSSDQQAGPL